MFNLKRRLNGMFRLRTIALLVACYATTPVNAQEYLDIALPAAQIKADKLIRGDGDTYGLGDWRCQFSFKLNGSQLEVRGNIRFSENANDFTTITGTYFQQIQVQELERCKHCELSLEDGSGFVKGPNIGARGYQWFNGYGLVRGAMIQTDTFGDDVGHIGGTVQFNTIRVLINCAMAAR